MKLSSSTLCGCCFCCYCHCWLMMLLMVLSVVHVSPEMSSTTTTTKKYTKLYNNNYAYQSEMTEFLQLNRKIPNRTSRTVAKTLTTTTSPPSLLLSTTSSPLTATITSTTDNHYKQNNVNSYPIFEHEAITTIATIQTQSTTITKTSTVVATQSATAAAMKTTLAPEQIQNPVDATTAQRIDNGIKRQADIFYIFDNSIEEKEENKELEAARNIETTSTNYVADYSKVFVPPTEPFVETLTMTNTRKQVNNYRKNHNTDNKRKNNLKNTKYWNASIDLNRNLRHQQQQHNNGYSRNSNLNNSESNNDFTNITKNISSKYKQKTTNTFNLNHNNRYGTVNNSRSINIIRHQQQKQQQNHLSISIANGIRIRATKSLDAAQIATTINSLPSSGTIDYRQSSTYNFKNHNSKYNNNKNLATSTDSVSNISPKEINHYSDDFSHHLQIPTSTLMTTALRTPATYSPLHEHHHSNQLKRPALLYRHTRQAAPEDEQNDKCRMFIEGDPEKNELYSPDYPNDYPKNINCTRVITAPKGQIIRLDFRNSFNIEEKDECKFDFLEIRDGQYGFSNLIGKYCGTDFPPEITSKERYLWLHFHSDESIEYSGFTAVYEFIDRNRDAPSTDLNCTIERDGYEGYVNATDVPTEIKDTVIRNKIPLDCMWRIQVQEKWKIQVKFVDFKLAKPNDCETNFLDIFPEQTVMPLRVKNFCGSAGEGITSDSNILHVRFYAEQSAINSTFSILYTAFRERGSSSCTEDEYDCEDATCIAGNLKCNGRSNCKFLWDEEDCDVGENGQSEHMTIIITVFGLILGGMVITFLVNCVRKIMHDQKIIREHIRQSKESKLDEMGRNSKARSRDNISIVSPRQKHSQTSLQILDDVSSRYYREIELQTKSNFKEKDPSILRHDMIVQTSLCSTDDSSTTITEQQQQPTPPAGVGTSACDMGCQTRESLFATASLMRQKSKTPSIGGSQRTIEGVPPPPRFSTFGYDAAQIAPPPPPTVSTLSRRNMHLPQESLEMEQLPQQTTHTMMMMPTPHQQQQQHQHLHHRPSQEICHHHHQHQQHLQQQQQKQTLPRHHQQQQPQHHQHMQQQQQHHHHTSSATIPPNVTQIPAPGTAVVTAISTGSSGRQREQANTGLSGGKGKQTKVDESKVFIDIRNSAPDVIIMTSH
ncbi:uncharacterized protein LOC111675712 isoform X1 [Lucilia cuprina]|uniref:uncharacterized protein LOC111675712 isoform X1 n=1 Tax=Lucilia cuprina TaxID=7375 RepID=UPI001F06FC8C|nr:uncharacterized protein LOC111675712 isoform X1 [Lucilia cuprina]